MSRELVPAWHEGSSHSLHSVVVLGVLVRSPGRLSVARLLRDGSQGREDAAVLRLASDLSTAGRVGVVAAVLEAGDLPRPHQLVPGGGTVVGHYRPKPGGVGGEGESTVTDLLGLLTIDRLAPEIFSSQLKYFLHEQHCTMYIPRTEK